MKIIGLTGSIGMGKTTASSMIRNFGIPVHDSDRVVHAAFTDNSSAICAIRKRFPEAVKDGVINRQKLGQLVLNNDMAIAELEGILHPIVKRDRCKFIRHYKAQQYFMVVIDVPLLFETNIHNECFQTIVMSAPAAVQTKRVLKRPGMTAEKFELVKLRQMPDEKKRSLGDIVILSHLGRRFTYNKLRNYFHSVRLQKYVKVKWKSRMEPHLDGFTRNRIRYGNNRS